MALVKSLVSGFVGYMDGDEHREARLETGQEFDASSVIVQARPELFTTPGATAEPPTAANRPRGK
jgi:hypothetical protein